MFVNSKLNGCFDCSAGKTDIVTVFVVLFFDLCYAYHMFSIGFMKIRKPQIRFVQDGMVSNGSCLVLPDHTASCAGDGHPMLHL